MCRAIAALQEEKEMRIGRELVLCVRRAQVRHAVLLALALLLIVCSLAQADNFWVDSRASTNNKYTWTGTWTNSTNSCTYASKGGTASDTSFVVTPTFGVAGGFYQVDVYHAGTSNVSSNLVTNCSVTSGGIAVTGDILGGSTSKWNTTIGSCSGGTIGIIKLNPGVTVAGLTFSYKSGTISSSYQWIVNTINLIQRTDVYSLTATGTGGTITQSGSGYYVANSSVTVTATPSANYAFSEWRDGTGARVSTSPSYTFTMPYGAVTLNAVFVLNGVVISTGVNPAASGTVTGAGMYSTGSTCTLTATPATGYSFSRWTSDQAGNNTVSTANPYAAIVAGPGTIYAQFVPGTYALTRSACAGGSVSGASGPVSTGTQVTVTATPDPGRWFNGWSTNACGGTVVSRNLTYTFTMPPHDYDLHANFSTQELVQDFEGYATGGDSFDSLDKNDPVGPNQAANADGNPWWGAVAPNGRINATRSHGGSKSLWGTAGNCRDLINLQTRCGGGSTMSGDVYLDWWFYDPLGPGGSATDFCGDYTALSYFTGMSTDKDYPEPMPGSLSPTQQLAIGMSDNLTGAYDPTKYQVRMNNTTGSYADGWFNTSVTRSVGWHHARVLIGAKKTPSNTNDVTYFIDNMATAVFGPRDCATTTGFNAIEVNTIMPKAGTCSSPTGCVYSKYFHYSGVDDVSFGSVPNAPGSGVPNGLGTGQITWNWVSNGGEDGFHIWDASSAGTIKATAAAGTTSMLESGLSANTQYSRWADSFVTRYAGSFSSQRTALPPTYTLALTPVCGASGNGAISCNNGQGNPPTPYQVGTSTIFTAVNGFGTGPSKASKYLYIWNTSAADPASWGSALPWTSGPLTETPTAPGSYYLHLRACNGDSVANPAALTLGPYTYAAPLSRITEAWALNDGDSFILTGKTVTAAFAGDCFWIEENDRTAAMRVVYSGASASWLDHSVTVTGALDSSMKPRTLVATEVTDLGALPSKLAPVEMVLKSLGGSSFDVRTPSITGGVGLYNIGLLVRVCGIVSFCDNTTDPSNKLFYISDGSSLVTGDGSGKAGVKVKCGTVMAPTAGTVSVTGVISMEQSPNGYVPVLIIRGATDLLPL